MHRLLPCLALDLTIVAAGALPWSCWPIWRPTHSGQDASPATPLERYKALLKDYQDATQGLAPARTDEQRARDRARVDQLPRRFLQLAEQSPEDPVAVEALTQVVWMENNSSHPAGGSDSPGGRAMALLLRDHVRSDQLGQGCQRLASCIRPECDTFLRTVLEQNPHREVQGAACLSLAQFLDNRRRRLELFQDQPELASRYADLLDRDYLEVWRRLDHAEAAQATAALYERAAAMYGDVKLPFIGTIGAKAQAELYELRHLEVGMVAPDIEGEDQDGRQFKLSDYRGKVVLLDFWQQT